MARTLATLLGGGIPLVNALEVAARSISNRYMAHELESVAQRVREGQGFAATLLERAVVPGRRDEDDRGRRVTGALQDMLNSLADFYDEEVETDGRAFRHADRAGAAGRHGHGHRGACAGALHAACSS